MQLSGNPPCLYYGAINKKHSICNWILSALSELCKNCLIIQYYEEIQELKCNVFSMQGTRQWNLIARQAAVACLHWASLRVSTTARNAGRSTRVRVLCCVTAPWAAALGWSWVMLKLRLAHVDCKWRYQVIYGVWHISSSHWDDSFHRSQQLLPGTKRNSLFCCL